MVIIQPVNATQLKDTHPSMHKTFAIFDGAPAQRVVVDADGNVYIGNQPAGNYVKVDSDNHLTLFGDSRVRRHWLVDPMRFKLPEVDYPSYGFEGLFYTFDFDSAKEESAYVQDHIPHRWDTDTDVEVGICWFHDGADAGKVVWGLEYRSITSGEVVAGAGTIITEVSAGNHPAGVLVCTDFTDKILKGNLEPEDDIAFRVFRKGDDENDTLVKDARFLQAHFHFIENKLGGSIE